MGSALFATESSVGMSTPAAGNARIFIDSQAKILSIKDEAGRIAGRYINSATAAQGAGFSSDTWVTNSDIIIPTYGFLQTKSQFLWKLSASKTGAGTAAPVYTIRTGSNRTTADTSRLALTGPAQTAIADIGTLMVMATIRSVGASGVLQGTAWWEHRGTAISSTIGVGFANDGTGHIEGSSAGFDMTALSGLYVSLSINGGASAAWTVTQVQSQVDW